MRETSNMKTTAIRMAVAVAVMMSAGGAMAQQALVPCGSVVTGLHGGFSYSAGQVAVQRSSSTDRQWNMAEGVVQPMLVEQESIEGVVPLQVVVAVGPNPTEGVLKISVEGDFEGEIHYDVMSINGQHLMAGRVEVPLMHLDMGGLPTGAYMLGLRDSEGRQSRYKIVKN